MPSPDSGGRRVRHFAAAAAILVSPGAAPAFAVEPNLYLHTAAWFASLSGDGETGSGGGSREFDVDETLGLDTDETVPSFDGFIRWEKNRVLLSWNHGSYSGDNRLEDDLDFKGLTFAAGGKLKSELDYDRRRVLYGRPIVDMKRFSIGYLIGIEAYDIEADLRMQGTGEASASLDSKVPLLGASYLFSPAPGLRFYAEATGISWERAGVDSKVLNAYGSVEYTLLGQALALSLGYRYALLDGEEKDAEQFLLKQKGLFAGLVLRL